MLTNQFDNQDNISMYSPPPEVLELTRHAKEEYSIGNEILTRAWPELNGMSVIDRDNRDRKTFNAFVDESEDDPTEAWKWRGTRSMARNKALAMHAHLTAGFLFPMIDAQDENDEEHRGIGDSMRDIVLWMGENSNYKTSFLQLMTGTLTSPVTYLSADFMQAMQVIKTKTAEGYSTKEVLDEELSGFRADVYGASDIMITNAYVQNIQQQDCVIKRKSLTYGDAKKKYGKHSNWEFVKKGANTVLGDENNLFYDASDPANPNTVSEVIVTWRSKDLEVPFVGGIYMGSENVDWNPVKHRDNLGNPRYNVTPFGYHRISEHFFYYKSLMNSLYWDDALNDAMYENIMNSEFLMRNPPIAIAGDDKIDSSVMFPGAQVVTANENLKIQSILPQRQDSSYKAMQMIEESMKEASLSDVQTGQLPEATQKAWNVARAEKNAQILLRGVAQSIGESIMQYGKLMVDIAVNHLSVPIIDEVSATVDRLKYRHFVLPRQTSKGKNITKIVRFSEDLIGKSMNKKQREVYALKLYQEAGDDKTISVVNPELAARMKYLIRIDVEQMFDQNREQMSQTLGNLYLQLRQDPLIDAETLVRKLMHSLLRSEGDELLASKGDIEKAMQAQTAVMQQATQPQTVQKPATPMNNTTPGATQRSQ